MVRPAIDQRRRTTERAALPHDVALLYSTHRLRFLRLASAITLDPSTSEEVVQEAFAGLYRRLAHVENPEAYLQRAVVNRSLNVVRRRRVAARHPLPSAPVAYPPEIDETWQAVARLPARQRAVVVLRFWSDLSEADMARVLGWRPGTVKSTLHRALLKLREELAS